MKIYNGPEVIFITEFQSIMQKSKSLCILGSVLKEHLLLIDRNPDMVESPLGNLSNIRLGKILCTELATGSALRQPMGNVHTLFNYESLIGILRATSRNRHYGKQK